MLCAIFLWTFLTLGHTLKNSEIKCNDLEQKQCPEVSIQLASDFSNITQNLQDVDHLIQKRAAKKKRKNRRRKRKRKRKRTKARRSRKGHKKGQIFDDEDMQSLAFRVASILGKNPFFFKYSQGTLKFCESFQC